MENRSRRNNMRVDGVTEDCENKVIEILRVKFEIEDVTIERAYRIKPYQNEKVTKARPHLGQ